jgi:DNA-binding GntR family transcriptional regulator
MKRIGSVQTKDQIADVIREFIISGRLIPEQEIVQEELADQLQLSRTPVREALQQLEKEGYLERLANRHMRIRATSPDEITRAFKIIAGIEYELLDIIMVKDIDILSLEKILRKLLDTCDTNQLNKARAYELEIHRTISEITSYGYLATLHQKLLAGYPRYAIMNSDSIPEGRVNGLRVAMDLLKRKSKAELKAAVEEYYFNLAACFFGSISPSGL